MATSSMLYWSSLRSSSLRRRSSLPGVTSAIAYASNPARERSPFTPTVTPHAQKDELERQCGEMLHLSIIQPGTSAFSSLALLIR